MADNDEMFHVEHRDDHTEVQSEWWVRSHAVLPAVGVSEEGVPEAFVHVRIEDGSGVHPFVMTADDADMLALHVMDCASLARTNAAASAGPSRCTGCGKPWSAASHVPGESKCCPDCDHTEASVDRRPHSRACGVWAHPHGRDCHPNCPTCGGLPSPT